MSAERPTPARLFPGRVVFTVVPPLLVFGLIIAAWYLTSLVLLAPESAFLLPPPHEVLRAGFFDAETRSDILAALWVTTKTALLGLAIAFGIGSVTAIAMAQAGWVQRSLYPYVVFLQTVPILAIVPVIGFWFGFDLFARLVVCVIIALFPLIINALHGLLGVDRGLRDLFDLVGADAFTRLIKLQIPNALPGVFVGLQSAAGLSVVGAVIGDFFFGRGATGLGLLLSRYSSRLASAEMLAAVLVACLLGLVTFWTFGALGRRTVGRWSEAWKSG